MQTYRNDIKSIDDIKALVDTFYTKVRANELLGHVFNARIENRWPIHLEKMYRFWQTVLLEEQTYFGSPFPPHTTMNIDETHFDEWLKIFGETVDELFEGQKAREAKWRAEKMAVMFLSKLNYYKINSGYPLM